MIGPILLAVTWVLLKIERKPISVIGINRPVQRTIEFVVGFVITAIFAAVLFLTRAYLGEYSWVANAQFTVMEALDGLRWIINSVLYEELVFRGYLLYKAIDILGARKGCWLSAIAFGVYHWFSYGVFGSLMPMIWVFLLTGSFGLMCAYAFERSRSVVLPIALHLGWNVVTILIFSSGPIGPQLLTAQPPEGIALTLSMQFLINLIMPISMTMLVLWVLLKKVPIYQRVQSSGKHS